jgi:hypothetical protein
MGRVLALLALFTGCRIGFDSRVSPDALVDTPAPIQLVEVQAPGYASAAMVQVRIGQIADDFLVAAVYWNESPDTVTLTDTSGLAWTSMPSQVVTTAGCGGTTGNATGAQLYYAQVSATGSNLITVTQTSGTQPLGLMLLEYSGIATANELDTSSAQLAPMASSTVSVPAFTTTGTGVIVAFFNDTTSTGSYTPGAGYTLEALDTGFPNLLEDAIVPAGTYMPDGALPSGHNDACWVGIAAAFRGR